MRGGNHAQRGLTSTRGVGVDGVPDRLLRIALARFIKRGVPLLATVSSRARLSATLQLL